MSIGIKFTYRHPDTDKPLAFGKVYTYETGTTTPKTTYGDMAKTITNTNPVILDATGSADIFFAGATKIIITDTNDVEVETIDPISSTTVEISLTPKYNTAGSAEAYKYWALSSASDVQDATLTSPSAGAVNMYVLLKNGLLPDTAKCTAIKTYVDTVRPLTDNLSVLPAIATNYTINVTYYVHSSNSAMLSQIQANVNNAVQAYIEWQYSQIGRDIDTDYLVSLMVEAGAKRVTVTNPAKTSIDTTHVAINTSKTVTYGGLEE